MSLWDWAPISPVRPFVYPSWGVGVPAFSRRFVTPNLPAVSQSQDRPSFMRTLHLGSSLRG